MRSASTGMKPVSEEKKADEQRGGVYGLSTKATAFSCRKAEKLRGRGKVALEMAFNRSPSLLSNIDFSDFRPLASTCYQ